jgi:hypothetical protein
LAHNRPACRNRRTSRTVVSRAVGIVRSVVGRCCWGAQSQSTGCKPEAYTRSPSSRPSTNGPRRALQLRLKVVTAATAKASLRIVGSSNSCGPTMQKIGLCVSDGICGTPFGRRIECGLFRKYARLPAAASAYWSRATTMASTARHHPSRVVLHRTFQSVSGVRIGEDLSSLRSSCSASARTLPPGLLACRSAPRPGTHAP